MTSVQTPSARTQPVPKLADARRVTLRDHILNIFRLVIKELRSIRSDPTMLILVVYAFSSSVNTVATGAVTEATNLSVGIGRIRTIAANRRGACASDLSACRADQSVRYRFKDEPG